MDWRLIVNIEDCEVIFPVVILSGVVVLVSVAGRPRWHGGHPTLSVPNNVDVGAQCQLCVRGCHQC